MKKIRTLLNQIKSDEEGAVVVIFTVAFVVFMCLLALSLDVGVAYLKAGEYQTVADSCAYSAGAKLPVSDTDLAEQNAIKDSAIAYAAKNGYDGLTREDVTLSNVYKGKYTAIKVSIEKNFPLNFAKIFGADSINIIRSAKAMLSPVYKENGLAPLGISKSDLQHAIDYNTYEHITLKYGKKIDDTTGNFGVLDLDGTEGGGASDYRLWFSQGYPAGIYTNDVLLTESGNMVGPTYQGFSDRYYACTHYGAQTGGPGCTSEQYDPNCPRIIKVIVYEDLTSQTAKVAGFAAFLLEDQTETGYITGTFLFKIDSTARGSGSAAGSSSDFGLYSLMLVE